MFKRFPRFFAVLLLLLFLPLYSLSADSFFDDVHLAYNAGLLLLASDNGDQGADPSALCFSAGISVAWQFHDFLRLEITEDLYFTNYEYNMEKGYPMACNPENRSAFVLGFVTGFNLTGFFPANDKGAIVRVYGGPTLDLRLVTQAFGLHPNDKADAKMQTEAIQKYFWSQGRMFLFAIGSGMDFPLTEKLQLGFDVRIWMPVYRLWTNENIPGIDGWRFGTGLRITPIRQNSKQNAEQPLD